MTLRISVFIPAYNAAETLPGVLARIPADAWPAIERVTIINDGSRDRTAAVAAELSARFDRVRVVDLPANEGYGRVVRRGLQISRDETSADIAVCLHADGQYPPEKVLPFAEHMVRHGIDVLQGSRHKDGTALQGGMPFYKYVAGRVLTAMENRVFGLKMTDYHSGFMFYSRRALATVPVERLSTYFDFDLEFIASARRHGLRIDELAIPTRYADEVSHLNPIVYGLRTLRVMAKYLAGRYDPAPARGVGQARTSGE